MLLENAPPPLVYSHLTLHNIAIIARQLITDLSGKIACLHDRSLRVVQLFMFKQRSVTAGGEMLLQTT